MHDYLCFSQEGGSSSSVLRHVQVQIIDRVTCRLQHSLINYVTEDMICAAVPNGGKDACNVMSNEMNTTDVKYDVIVG